MAKTSVGDVRNSVTVSVKIKKPTAQYGSIELMASMTMAQPDDATIEDLAAKEVELWLRLMGEAESQAAVMRDNQLAEAPPMPPSLASEPPASSASRIPTTAKPTNPPATAQPAISSIAWRQEKYAPKSDGRQVGQCWATKVLSFEKGSFVGKSGKEFVALKLWLENGSYPVKEFYVFHNHPAYPTDGTAWRDFFAEGGQFDIADKNVYCVLAVTGALRDGKYDVVPMAFTTKPDSAATLLPALVE